MMDLADCISLTKQLLTQQFTKNSEYHKSILYHLERMEVLAPATSDIHADEGLRHSDDLFKLVLCHVAPNKTIGSRCVVALAREGIHCAADLRDKSQKEVLGYRNIGIRHLRIIELALSMFDMALVNSEDIPTSEEEIRRLKVRAREARKRAK